MEPEALSPQQWHDLLTSDAYSMGQLKALCHQLGVDPESLHHATKGELAIDLVQFLHRHGRIPDLSAAHAQRTTRHSDSLTGYRQRVLEETQYLDLKGIPLPTGRDGRTHTPQIPLDKIYIQLQAVAQKEQRQRERAEEKALADQMRQEQAPARVDVMAGIRTLGEYFYRQGKVYEAAERPQPVDPQTALAEHKRLVILGAPGAGKSTLLRYLARRAAEKEAGPIPIHISLRDFAVAYDNNRTLTLQDYALQRVGGGETLRLALQTAVEQGWVFWLLDGLDETRLLADEISRQASQLPGGLLLTSRPVGYSRGGLHNLPHFEVLPLTPEKVEQFLHDWMAVFAEEGEGETAVAERITALQKQLAERPQLQALTRNPLLLTFMVVLGSLQGARPLPHKRADLYALYLEQLQAWEMGRLAQASSGLNAFEFRMGALVGEAAKKVVAEGLNYLGWVLFLNYYGGRATQAPTPEALIQQVAGYFAQDGYGESEDLAKKVLAFWREAGMLDIWTLEGHDYLAFRHFTFLEYTAVWGLRRAWERNERGTWRFLKPRLHHPAWQEPILLWGGGLPPAAISKVLRRLYWGVSSDERILHRDLLLAAALLAENPQAERKVVEKIVRRLAWLGRSHILLKFFAFSMIWLVLPLGLLVWAWGWLGLFLFVSITGGFAVIFLYNSNFREFVKSRQNFLLYPLQLHGLVSTPFKPIYQWLITLHSIPNLIAALQDAHDEVCQEAIEALEKIGKTAVPHLITTLHEANGKVRQEVVIVLGLIGDATAVPHLIAALQDEEWGVRHYASKALEQIREATTVPYPIVEVEAEEDKGCSIPYEVNEVLGTIGEEAVPRLIAALQDEDMEVRWKATEALEHIGKVGLPHLIAALQDKDDRLRGNTAYVLGQVGDATAVPHLIVALQDKNYMVRCSAAEALAKMSVTIENPQELVTVRNFFWSRDPTSSEYN